MGITKKNAQNDRNAWQKLIIKEIVMHGNNKRRNNNNKKIAVLFAITQR